MGTTHLVDLNHATAEELLTVNIKDMSENRVENLLEYRERYGPFLSWDDVKNVPGFNEEIIKDLREVGVTISVFPDKETGRI
jgi:competence ComEA-like helix-hairpin-helix protein